MAENIPSEVIVARIDIPRRRLRSHQPRRCNLLRAVVVGAITISRNVLKSFLMTSPSLKRALTIIAREELVLICTMLICGQPVQSPKATCNLENPIPRQGILSCRKIPREGMIMGPLGMQERSTKTQLHWKNKGFDSAK